MEKEKKMKKLMFLTAVLMMLTGTALSDTVNVDDTVTYQQIDGFGASYTESAAYLVENMGSTARQTLVNNLFGSSGIRLSVLRQPMGSSDFAIAEHYTYDDMPQGQTDYNLNNFSINNDLAYIIPAILDAKAANSNLKVIGVPWSAPAWMKTNGSLYNGGSLINSDQIYDTYSDYFVRFKDAYAAQGISIWAVSLGNEPGYGPSNYPGMIMSTADQIRLAKALGPKIGSAKIQIYDHNWDNSSYPISVLSDSQANQYIDGAAFHCYGGDVSAQTTVHDAHPDKDIYFTECTASLSGDPEGDFIWCMENIVIGTLRNWATTVIEWNMALDDTGGPKIAGGCESCKGIVTISGSSVTYEPEYYAFGHASKFVDTDAYRIYSDHSSTVAFRNPDNSIVLVLCNSQTISVNYDVNWNGQSFSYNVPARSATTFTWPDVSGATVNVWLTKGDQSIQLEQQANTSFGGGGSYCGDGTCDSGEDQCNCSADCGTPPSTETGLCTDG
ncbi:MAG: glucan endo-1,6-beta-glucosidase, partial [Planctomycetes bacterium]|nr:glucan endo-1,6-beta-glucosidase [Planctomycetota bacterium]